MDYFPFFMRLRGQRVLLVGGGDIATRKARLLAKAGAKLHVVSLAIESELEALVARTEGSLRLGEFVDTDLDGVVLAVAATDDAGVNQRISEQAQARHLPVNVVDSPELCTVITPAIVDRSPLVIAISSGGEAPVLARRVRSKLEQMLPASYGRLAGLASRFRQAVKDKFGDGDQRRRFWEKVLEGPIAEQVYAGNEAEAESMLANELASETGQTGGEVYLVGGGPGDPELLTLKALRLMQQAEVVLYDRLVSSEVMELVRRDADRIYVGKRRSEHSLPQPEINQLLLNLAKQGKRVLRLKGGDPFIFGRGGEEIELLAANGIPFQVVPGITAASGCAAYAGIPLTHRDHAQSVRFITGHLKNNDPNLSWPELAMPGQTLVFYMGLMGLEEIAQMLLKNGRSPLTPVALIEKGTTREQRVIVGNLQTITAKVEEFAAKGPTLIIVGEVVSLRGHLDWFGDRDRQNVN
ncbi:siroheme synthase CysG [Gilvimarinus sp. SDUM040013]|uniref:Siroheme synthase n=1 Tax=Gilvimarinus gilvus TaxID=3058038 RepID=A0ABU4S043_9GAMM|nr:siroheme synthase CysG [Gilvimarinus sp. SDUM040013]MDO3388776.1 siroheme synthase CysG [Gilvimarinus sp. SDUM040013]MDX6850529.1 siroheme synthase CysG [Gilvimarinus sp. SDUM040013]